MSATYRNDVGVEAWKSLWNWYLITPGDMCVPGGMAELKAKECTRWQGIRRTRWKCHSFAIKLPRQIELGYCLHRFCDYVLKNCGVGENGLARMGIEKIRRNMAIGLGLECRPREPESISENERILLASMDLQPGDLSLWAAYADCLVDVNTERSTMRSEIIRGWLGKKAIKVKYGIPEIGKKLLDHSR